MEVLTHNSNLELRMYFLLVCLTVWTLIHLHLVMRHETPYTYLGQLLSTIYYPIDQPGDQLI